MKILKNVSIAALLVMVSLFSACQKNKEADNFEPDPVVISQPCKLAKVIYYEPETSAPVVSNITEYIYDSNNNVSRINELDSTNQLLSFLTYSYNAHGKAAEEIYHAADGTIGGKQIFTYNSNNLLRRIDIIGSVFGKYYPEPSRIELHYNDLGQRIRADFYSKSQPNIIDQYFEYTYSQGKVLANEYENSTNPATLKQMLEFQYDNNKSAYYALGYLNGYIPELEKHNVVLYKEYGTGFSSSNFTHYDYNNWGYPTTTVYVSKGWGPYHRKYVYECQ